jgi:hypothetical protein
MIVPDASAMGPTGDLHRNIPPFYLHGTTSVETRRGIIRSADGILQGSPISGENPDEPLIILQVMGDAHGSS